jgi:hypothetical protein
MSVVRPARRALRDHLSYANVMATIAVFLVLGGGAYAAATLPNNSVGTAQLRPAAVTRSKLADDSVSTSQLVHNSVTRNRLSAGLRALLAQAGQPGPPGVTGPAGPKGADGASAGRVQYDAAATATPVATTILDIPGLTIQAGCVQNGADVNVGLRINPSETAVLQANFTLDSGTDPTAVGLAQTANAQIALTANTDNDLGGPGTAGGTGYSRVNARAIMVGAARTFTLDLFELVNADTGRCTIGGTALPS